MNDQIKDSSLSAYSSIRFYVSDEMLLAEFNPDSLKEPLDETTIVQLLESSGLGKHILEEEALHNLVEHSENNHQGDISLEKHTDASFELKIDKQQMSAAIAIQPAQGGEDLIYDEVLAFIIEASIDEQYLDRKLLANCLNVEHEKPPVIATGIAPVNGEDSKFEILFNTVTETGPKKTDAGNIDHYETHQYITVDENQPVMKRIPHTTGTPGHTVTGEEVSAENGKVIKFSIDNTVKVDKADPNMLLAAKKGHPVASETGVHIDDTLKVKEADLKSGNIHFDGSVEITGEVHPNVVVEASGDVFVHGMVENATLISGNDITVGAGILSSKLYDHNSEDDFMPECRLKAKGTIVAKYCNTICAIAKKDIKIETYSMHSQLSAGRNLIFGDDNGKGVVIGGINFGKYGISANVIGSDAYVKTTIECGNQQTIKKQQHKIQKRIKRFRNELALLETMLNKIKSKGTPTTLGKVILKKAKKIFDEINKNKDIINDLELKLKSIDNELSLSQHVKIHAHKKLYSNVHITINGVHSISNREHEETIISCEDYQLQFN